jgi:DNA-binding NtrC family response regulator
MTELKTILHVDDDEDILEITRMALQLVDSSSCTNAPAVPMRWQ